MGESEKHHADFTNFKTSNEKREILQQVIDSYSALVDGQTNWVCNLSNASSLIWHAYHSIPTNINWAGFYVLDPKDQDQLILGPFQGKVACQLIKFGKGVCGTAASTKLTQLVPDVEKFPGHIACDGGTQSEIVVPIIDKTGIVRGVLDIDCLDLNGFDETDKEFLEKLAQLIAETNDW
ncbi:hypothetical protein WICMUC_000833 [Wickerhamomyces mucosus]|uniref:GAF domain-containing protein n=1 Tax=Wickerhamomyces mucosus TaxID=1378264 RepID=A0A9P8PWG1_9ASCO|nr:hypothetical protein WICMUC_000833 [Wickerhamomyces mucosus]